VSVDRAVEDRRRARLRLGLALTLLFLLVALGLDLFLGSVRIGPTEALRALRGLGASPEEIIFRSFRLPRAAAALLGGGALGVSGLLMQTLLGNPLAGPDILGVEAGAGLGVALTLVAAVGLDLPLLSRLLDGGGVAAAAWVGAFATLGFLVPAARRIRGRATLLILGMMFGYLAGALVALLLQFGSAEQAHGYLIWSFGSFGAVTGRRLAVMAAGILPPLAGTLFLAKSLNALLVGENYARTLGVPVGAMRTRTILITALLSGSVTAFCGPIAFLGLATAHLCRGLLRTEDHRALLPACCALGAALALAADALSHAPGGGVVLPLNALTSLIGAPVVVRVLLRGEVARKEASS